MRANVGDWLLVKDRTEGRPERCAAILAVRAEGRSPFTVRWIDDGREAVVFPGTDAYVVAARQHASRNFDAAWPMAAAQLGSTAEPPSQPME